MSLFFPVNPVLQEQRIAAEQSQQAEKARQAENAKNFWGNVISAGEQNRKAAELAQQVQAQNRKNFSWANLIAAGEQNRIAAEKAQQAEKARQAENMKNFMANITAAREQSRIAAQSQQARNNTIFMSLNDINEAKQNLLVTAQKISEEQNTLNIKYSQLLNQYEKLLQDYNAEVAAHREETQAMVILINKMNEITEILRSVGLI